MVRINPQRVKVAADLLDLTETETKYYLA